MIVGLCGEAVYPVALLILFWLQNSSVGEREDQFLFDKRIPSGQSEAVGQNHHKAAVIVEIQPGIPIGLRTSAKSRDQNRPGTGSFPGGFCTAGLINIPIVNELTIVFENEQFRIIPNGNKLSEADVVIQLNSSRHNIAVVDQGAAVDDAAQLGGIQGYAF